MARELPNRFNSSLWIPPTRSAPSGKSNAGGVALRRQEPAVAENGTSVGDAPPTRLLRFPAVRERTGLSRSTIWRLERRGDFPQHRRISANVVAWVETEVAGWIQSRVKPGAG